jgi:carboxymethylenebutenolidase
MQNQDQNDQGASKQEISRRQVAKLAVGAALASSALPAEAEAHIVEKMVTVQTPDGMCDAAFIHPRKGAHPGVLIWPDAFGLRPAMQDIGKRIAAEGYTVLVVNPYYRVGPASTLNLSTTTFSFQNPDDMARLRKLMSGLQAPDAAQRDAKAFVAFLDEQKQTDTSKKIGTQGYCMGGPLVFKTVASLPDRVGAGASFHGGGLVTDQPNSPHLLIPQMKAKMYVGIASNDDARQPDAKDKLREAFDAAHVTAEVEVYQGLHGWCVPDMPMQDGKPIYNKPEAEKAWGKLVALYKSALA